MPEKAPDLLVRSFRCIPGDIRLVVAGGSSYSDAYRTELMEHASKDARVLLTGNVYGDALGELYSNAAAFVLPSDLEGMPLTLLEAASYGTPIVASDIAPHVEVLDPPGPGRRLFRAGDEEALTAALNDALSDQTAEREGAAKLREQVLGEYNWDAAVDVTEGVYERALDRRRPRSNS